VQKYCPNKFLKTFKRGKNKMSAKNTEKLGRYWVEELKNPPNTIRFIKDHRTKFVCVVCDDDAERVGDRKSLLERHSQGSVHQNNLKKFYGKKDHISVSSDDEANEKNVGGEKTEKRRVGRPRKNPLPEKKKEEEEESEEESDSDRPSRKRERTKDIDLAYRPTAAARVANSVATLPMTRRESSVTPVVPATAPPARAGPPLAQSLFAERFSNIIDKVLMSDIANDACREEFVTLLKTDGMQNQVRTQLKRGLREQGPSVLMEVLRELIEEEEKEHVRTFLKSDKAADMRGDAYVRHLDGPQTQMFFAEGTQGFFNE
jgi:hypothetical protein